MPPNVHRCPLSNAPIACSTASAPPVRWSARCIARCCRSLIAALPSLGVAAWLGDGFERGFVVFATLLGLFSVVWGYRRHRAVRALGLLLPGLARCGSASCTRRCTTRCCRMRSR